ncbi:MAG: cytochrome c [Planctomycetota bacterium]
MRANRLFWIAVVAVVSGALWLVLDVARPDPRQRNLEFFPDMAYSPAADSFEANGAFANGQTLQLPPDGTCARDFDELPFGPDRPGFLSADAEMRLCGAEVKMPTRFAQSTDETATAHDQARGRLIFSRFCAVCHGPTGQGDGAVAARITAAQFPLASRTSMLNDGELYYVISRGSRSGVMAGYAAWISPDDRWRLIRFLRQSASQ